MNRPTAVLTKTCMNCGLQKPLSAFLQVNSSEGAVYGTICSSCRKTSMATDEVEKDQEDGTRDTTKITIDSKSKIHSDIGKEEHYQRTELLNQEEQKKTDEINVEKSLKTETTVKDEKKRLKNFLERNRGQRETTKKVEQVSSFEEQAAKEKEIDLANPFLDTQHGYKFKFGTEFDKAKKHHGFRKWLDHGPADTEKAAQPSQNKSSPSKKDPLIEYIEKTWGPNKRR